MVKKEVETMCKKYLADVREYSFYDLSDEDVQNGIIYAYKYCVDMALEGIDDYKRGKTSARSTLAEIKGIFSDDNIRTYALGYAMECCEERAAQQ